MKSLNLAAKPAIKCYPEFEDLLQELLQKEPKPQNISKTIYLTCLAISILTQMGNKFPSQAEIDMVELNIKRYSLRKSTKPLFNQACQVVPAINLISKAA